MQDGKAKERQDEVKGDGQTRQAHVDGAGVSSQAHFPHAAGLRKKESDSEAQKTFKYHDEIFTSCCMAITNTRVDQNTKKTKKNKMEEMTTDGDYF